MIGEGTCYFSMDFGAKMGRGWCWDPFPWSSVLWSNRTISDRNWIFHFLALKMASMAWARSEQQLIDSKAPNAAFSHSPSLLFRLWSQKQSTILRAPYFIFRNNDACSGIIGAHWWNLIRGEELNLFVGSTDRGRKMIGTGLGTRVGCGKNSHQISN